LTYQNQNTMSQIKKVTVTELATILFAMQFQKGAAVFASVLQFTDARLLKRGNPYPNTMKLTQLGIMLNTEYEKGVTNQLAREDKDASEYVKGTNTMPLEFGENNRFIGTFNGKPVIQYRPFDNSHPRTKYIADGKIIDKAKIANFIPAKKAAENQGTEKEIFWRKLYLSNVRKMKIGKQVYKVVEA
jgi:hypothetical protein